MCQITKTHPALPTEIHQNEAWHSSKQINASDCFFVLRVAKCCVLSDGRNWFSLQPTIPAIREAFPPHPLLLEIYKVVLIGSTLANWIWERTITLWSQSRYHRFRPGKGKHLGDIADFSEALTGCAEAKEDNAAPAATRRRPRQSTSRKAFEKGPCVWQGIKGLGTPWSNGSEIWKILLIYVSVHQTTIVGWCAFR